MGEDPAMRTKTIESIAEDRIWIYANWKKLCLTHAGQVIGVDGSRVIAAAQSFGHLTTKVKEMGLKPAHVVAAYINADPDFVEKFIGTREQKIEALRDSNFLS